MIIDVIGLDSHKLVSIQSLKTGETGFLASDRHKILWDIPVIKLTCGFLVDLKNGNIYENYSFVLPMNFNLVVNNEK